MLQYRLSLSCCLVSFWNTTIILSLSLIFTAVLFLSNVNGANILVAFPAPGYSHFKPFEPFFFRLRERGHNLTVVSVYEINEKLVNYTVIKHVERPLGDINLAETREQYRMENWAYVYRILQEYNLETTLEKSFQDLFTSNDTKFDLIFVEIYHMDIFFALGHRFNCPIIGISFQPILPNYHWIIKNPTSFSYIPHGYSPYTDRMTFPQRLINSVFYIFTVVFHNFVSISDCERDLNEIYKAANIGPIPTYEDLMTRLSLILVESHFSADHVRPNLPNVIDVAGIHIGAGKPLTKDLQTFVDNSENGIIYVSLGTLIDPECAREVGIKLINIFQKIPYRVIWKWKTDLINQTSDNVLIGEWFPQIDILNHPKCKLFISHGGYHSLLETIHAGVPILGLPFFTDQHYNTAIVEKFDIGLKRSPEDDENDLQEAIIELLTNKKYKENVQFQSKLFRDRPMSPMDTAIYWTEYVIRYKGASHLKSAATELYWFQYVGLDIVSVYLMTIVLFFYSVRKCVSKCCRNGKSKPVTKFKKIQ